MKDRKKENRLSGPTKAPRARKKGKFMYVAWRKHSAICVVFPPVRQFFSFSERYGSTGQLRETVALFRSPVYLSSPNDPRFLGELRAQALSKLAEISLLPRIFPLMRLSMFYGSTISARLLSYYEFSSCATSIL